MPWRSSVPQIASNMPASPAQMPWRAVVGELIHFRERMNNTLAIRYKSSITTWPPASSPVIIWSPNQPPI